MTVAIGHRGEPVDHVENTLESITAAFAAGADMVEIDVRLTADGVPVLLHDADLRRIWGVEQSLDRMSAAEVTRLRGPKGVRVPTLVDVVELLSGTDRQLMVDLPDAMAGPVAFRTLHGLGYDRQALFAGETAPLRRTFSAARIALTWDQLEPPDEQTLEFYRPEYFNPHFQLLTASIADEMHARGIAISVWTVDHPRDMAAVITQGADAVITNRIGELIRVLDR